MIAESGRCALRRQVRHVEVDLVAVSLRHLANDGARTMSRAANSARSS